MARRARKSLTSLASMLGGSLQRSMQRQLKSMTRAALRAGQRAAAKATRDATREAARAVKAAKASKASKTLRAARPAAPKPPRRRPMAGAVPAPPATPNGGRWTSGSAVGPAGARRYRLFAPSAARPATPLPVLVLLHGCDQDAATIARSTRLPALAARVGFLLVCPEQPRLANAHGCWNWFDTRSGRAQAEAASIVAVIAQVCARHGGDAARVAIAGLSAGASMAALVALRQPAAVHAVVMHSGVGPGAARSTATAIAAMQGRRPPGALPASVAAAGLPALLVIQGRADPVVNVRNGRAVAQHWADAAGATAGPARTVQRGARHAASVTDFKRGRRVVVTLCEIDRLGHAWSGGATSLPYGDANGPDASRMAWAFAQRQFAVAAAAPADAAAAER